MGQSVSKPIVDEIKETSQEQFDKEPIQFIKKRFEFRARLEEWGYIWAQKILNQFTASQSDMKWVLSLLNKEDMARLVSEDQIDTMPASDSKSIDNDTFIQNLIGTGLFKESEELEDNKNEDEDGYIEPIQSMLNILTLMCKGIVHLIVGASAIDILVESDWYFEILEEFDQKIQILKKEIANELFQKKLHDLKTKFSAILTIFQKVINGKDEFITRKKRLDSLFYHCEEIIILITDVDSLIFNNAHLCIDFVSNFLVFHLGMLQIAEESFGLRDYAERRDNALRFYPTLIKSYIDKATSYYVKSIVLQYNSRNLKDYEEIINQVTGETVYRIKNSGVHPIWDGTAKKDLAKDGISYSIDDDNLVQIKPSLLCSAETPWILRALRNGVSTKTHEYLAQYERGVQRCASLFARRVTKKDIDNDFNVPDTENQDLDSSISTLCSNKDDEKQISVSQKYHESRVEKLENYAEMSKSLKHDAEKELKKLESKYSKTVDRACLMTGITENEIVKMKNEFLNSLKDSEEEISSMNKYLCFTLENQRYFNVGF